MRLQDMIARGIKLRYKYPPEHLLSLADVSKKTQAMLRSERFAH